MASVEIIKSEKGRDLIVYDGFKFAFHKLLCGGKAKRWLCTSRSKTRSCKAYLKTEGSNNAVVEVLVDHNHEKPLCEDLQRQTLNNKLKRKAVEDLCERPMKLIHTELRNSDIDTVTVSDINRMRKNMYRARRSVQPKLPKSMEDLHNCLEEYPVKTNKDEIFLCQNDKVNHIIMLTCPTNINFLCTNIKAIYVDGTFEYAPKLFMQLFTIHGIKNNHYIPLVFFFLPNKTAHTYKTAFAHLKEECARQGFEYCPEIVTADFEIAIHQGVQEVFPHAVIKGCRFHLGQAWWRKIQDVGLAKEYRENKDSEVSKYISHMFGLPFLNPEDVGNCFAYDFVSDQPESRPLVIFSDYILNTYISEEATFPPHMWAEMSSSTERTTNCCESFHSRFNKCFYSPHPDIYKCIQTLTDFQIDTYIKQKSCIIVKPIYDSQVIKKQKFLQEKIVEFKAGKTTMIQFVRSVSYRFRAVPFK